MNGLLNQAFLGYLSARIAIGIANTMLTVALGWHLYEITGDPWSLALVGLMQIIPVYVFFFVSGYVIDRFPRVWVVRSCAFVEAIAVVGISQIFSQENPELLTLYALVFLHGAGRAFHGPGLHAIVPTIVPRQVLDRAIAMSSTSWNAASIAGPVVAGYLILALDRGVYDIIAVASAATLIGYLFIPAIRIPQEQGDKLKTLLAGIQYVRGQPIILGGLTIDLLMVGFGSVMVLLPVFAADILLVGPEELGLMRGMPALGSVLMGILLSTRRHELSSAGLKLWLSLIAFAVSILVFSLSEFLILSLIALFVYGASDMVSVNIRMGMVQSATPEQLRGRVAAVNMLFIQTSNEGGDFRGGALAGLFGPVYTVFIGGVLGLGFLMWSRKQFPALYTLDKISDLSAQEKAAST
ncbi:MFS transporter [Litorivicinus sp.]|nr:MFS transporter [Litorivicinus sp.]MDC1087741.1 MFS transporter [Litorivicinus sp.]